MKYRISFSHPKRCASRWVLSIVVGLTCAVAQAFAESPVSGDTSEFWGKWQQGALIRGKVQPGTQVSFAGKAVHVTPDGRFVLGLGRDAAPHATVTIIDSAGKSREHIFDVAQREYHIQRIEGVASKHVTPPASVTERIRAEAEQVYLARQTVGDNPDFLQSFQWPLKGPITGVYGSQRFYNGEPRSPHYGVDIAAPTGTPVKAPAAGIVTLAHDDMYYSGGTLIVDHGYGLSSTFIHLHKIHVKPGQRVEQGDLIAEVGASGRATGPHLDWRMNWFDARVDPQLLMAEQGQPTP
jgi:murein DD-endopeptidase MepM/ murein hydrolase activator NlpD